MKIFRGFLPVYFLLCGLAFPQAYPLTGTDLTTPGPIGSVTPATGAFTSLSATGIASFADGSNTLPSIAFASDPDNGFFKPATANTVGIVAGGSERFRFSASIFTTTSNVTMSWCNTTFSSGTVDIGISRNAAGVLEVNNGTLGTHRDLIARNVTVGGTSGTAVTLIRSAAATLDFPSTITQTSSDLPITLNGAVDGDGVIVSPPNGSANANSAFTARISAADTVTVTFHNYQAVTAINPASGTFRVSILRF